MAGQSDLTRRLIAQGFQPRRPRPTAFRLAGVIIALVWVAIALTLAAVSVALVKVGPHGLATEAGRLAGSFERGLEQAR